MDNNVSVANKEYLLGAYNLISYIDFMSKPSAR